MGLAYEKGRQERLRIVDELNYERAKSGRRSSSGIRLQKELSDAKTRLLQRIAAEHTKGKMADRARMTELRSELRGLLFGRR